MDVSELKRQHVEIAKVARLLGATVANAAQPQPIAALRWQLARLLMTHLAMEDRLFYPALQRMADSAARETGARFQTEMGGLGASFSTYMAHWSDDRVAADWPGFCAATRALLAALANRIEREDRQLYPLVERADGTNRRRSAG